MAPIPLLRGLVVQRRFYTHRGTFPAFYGNLDKPLPFSQFPRKLILSRPQVRCTHLPGQVWSWIPPMYLSRAMPPGAAEVGEGARTIELVVRTRYGQPPKQPLIGRRRKGLQTIVSFVRFQVQGDPYPCRGTRPDDTETRP